MCVTYLYQVEFKTNCYTETNHCSKDKHFVVVKLFTVLNYLYLLCIYNIYIKILYYIISLNKCTFFLII